MAGSLVVPVIDVQNDNFKELWPAMVVAIKTSSFVALDTELSGLGNRKSLLAESIEDRYKAICHAARSRSILSLGIACFKKLDHKVTDTYLVQVYNLTLLCSEEYIIEPQSVQFLVQHGFDFNKQYGHGIPYCKGNNKGGSDDRGVHIRALFTELLRARKPLVLHNGLIDMAFLYQCFYAHLPERLATFTADLSEMFPAGIYDTKYVTEFELRLTASYLEYAYKKCKLDNSRSLTSGAPGPHVHIEFCQYAGHMSTYVDYKECPDVASSEGQTDICQRFSAFGWCPNGSQCPLSHDTDLIILQDEKGKEDKRKKRRRQKNKRSGGGDVAEGSSIFDGAPQNKIPHMEVDQDATPGEQQEETAESCPDSVAVMDRDGNTQQNDGESIKVDSEGNGMCKDNTDSRNSAPTDDGTKTDNGVESSTVGAGREKSTDAQKKKVDTGTHRAGFDAFMTGYIFACSCTLTKKEEVKGEAEEKEHKEEEQSWLPTCLNKVYLSGKAAPLNVVKSTFSKSSKAHMQKMEMVWSGRM
ncbi:target of EGR1 protein 1 [Stegastes partitus]|uniref:Target of EGR1 protein 1 n=1 Tax=Stegastes partitus TaxID=144197 RepID=A0A3B5AG10_9TELE|nr:PREDICTED: target of EGR1 protein 1 [Stegastes partitus]